jgi:hypothetical protein
MLHMPDRVSLALVVLVFLMLAGLSATILVHPSAYLRWIRNPWMEDSPWNRVQMRILGLCVSLFTLMVITGFLSRASTSALLENFHQNVLMGLWVIFLTAWVGGLLSWILWRIPSIRNSVRWRFTTDKLEAPAWERRMTRIFCSLLLVVVGIALVLAAMGYHG